MHKEIGVTMLHTKSFHIYSPTLSSTSLKEELKYGFTLP